MALTCVHPPAADVEAFAHATQLPRRFNAPATGACPSIHHRTHAALACAADVVHPRRLWNASSAAMQAVLAPFVLENVECTGAEQRLIDCPVDDDDSEYQIVFDSRDYAYSNSALSPTCEPFGLSYAFVACGGDSGSAPAGPGAPSSVRDTGVEQRPCAGTICDVV